VKKMKKTKKNNPLSGKEELARLDRLDRLDRFIWHPGDLRMIEEAGRGSNELGKAGGLSEMSNLGVRKRNQKSKTLAGTRKKAGNKESK